MVVLAVDPGTVKCGLAVVSQTVLAHEIVPTENVAERVAELIRDHSVDKVLLGNGTSAKAVRQKLGAVAIVELVEERHSTEKARQRYFQDHPPRGWQRLLPAGLRLPPGPVDDYAAVVLAEAYLGTKPA